MTHLDPQNEVQVQLFGPRRETRKSKRIRHPTKNQRGSPETQHLGKWQGLWGKDHNIRVSRQEYISNTYGLKTQLAIVVAVISATITTYTNILRMQVWNL